MTFLVPPRSSVLGYNTRDGPRAHWTIPPNFPILRPITSHLRGRLPLGELEKCFSACYLPRPHLWGIMPLPPTPSESLQAVGGPSLTNPDIPTLLAPWLLSVTRYSNLFVFAEILTSQLEPSQSCTGLDPSREKEAEVCATPRSSCSPCWLQFGIAGSFPNSLPPRQEEPCLLLGGT